MKCTQDAFEAKWEELVHEFSLEENEYIKKLQKHRGRQAKSYLRSHFFTRMRATQRYEKINAFLKSCLKDKM